jgi:hypothetical protein
MVAQIVPGVQFDVNFLTRLSTSKSQGSAVNMSLLAHPIDGITGDFFQTIFIHLRPLAIAVIGWTGYIIAGPYGIHRTTTAIGHERHG